MVAQIQSAQADFVARRPKAAILIAGGWGYGLI